LYLINPNLDTKQYKAASMENKYKNGEVVVERIRPSLKLIVSRYVNGIYYCLIQERSSKRELVYFERELGTGIHA
jgi:uncharacterized protein YodC (DUF2158 family)